MKVPLLDLKRQYQSIKEEIDRAIRSVVELQYFILGEEVEKFENQIANYCNVEHAIGVASGTDALLLSLRACGVGDSKNDKVITTPFTFFATAGAIVNAGATPVFVDIDSKTYNMDPKKLEELLTQEPKLASNVKALIPIHLYGQIADMDPIMELTREYNIKVIEDAAQAIGAEYENRKAGTIGNLGAFSFFPSKNLGGYGDGGMVITNDTELAENVRKLRVHGSTHGYFHDIVGYNSRLDAIQAAILSAKFPYFDEWSKARIENAMYYAKNLKDSDSIQLPTVSDNRTHIYHQYTIRVLNGKRDMFQMHLKERDIGTKIYYPLPLHLQECFKYLGYKESDFPVSEKASKQVLSLPVYPELNQQEMDYVVRGIKNFLIDE